MDNIKISRMDDSESAKKDAAAYKHNVVCQISEMMVDTDVNKIDWDEVSEAYFFDQSSELHFFRTENDLACVKSEEIAGSGHMVTHTYEIADAVRKGRPDKAVLEVREYLDFDEDGQCFVAYTRLADIRSESRR